LLFPHKEGSQPFLRERHTLISSACGYNVSSMIAHLRGTLLVKHPNRIVIETSGVGYEINISVPTYSDLPAIGSEVAVHIYTHVREDILALYGFLQLTEKQLFEKLMTVSGIGAKLAITILSGMPAEEMTGAIRSNDIARLTKIPGIGRKTAERMVLELRDKLAPPTAAAMTAAPSLSTVEEDVLSALTNLGYPRQAAEKAVAGLARGGESASFEGIFRASLARLFR
jgi:Holliday junction DNA helicase RuvA